MATVSAGSEVSFVCLKAGLRGWIFKRIKHQGIAFDHSAIYSALSDFFGGPVHEYPRPAS